MKFSVTETIFGGGKRKARPIRTRRPEGALATRFLIKRRDGEPFKILFLSKRGVSRAPMAREVMRELLRKSALPGSFKVSCRGVTPEYDQCPIDVRMKEVSIHKKYSLQGLSRYALEADLNRAELILPMDAESEAFIQENLEKIKGVLKPFGHFLPTGSNPHLPDPFLQRHEDYEAHYRSLIAMIEKGCEDLFDSIPFMLG
jgi:protein-tyrosine-phosphatase